MVCKSLPRATAAFVARGHGSRIPSPPFDLQRYGCAILTRKEKGGSSDPPFCIFACTVSAQDFGRWPGRDSSAKYFAAWAGGSRGAGVSP
jgi:hypothetical protein